MKILGLIAISFIPLLFAIWGLHFSKKKMRKQASQCMDGALTMVVIFLTVIMTRGI